MPQFGKNAPTDVGSWGREPQLGPGLLSTVDQGSGPGAGTTKSVQIPRADVEELPTSNELFRGIKTVALAAGPGTVVIPPALDFQVGQEDVAVVTFISLLINNPLLTTDLDLALLVNGAPYPGLGQLFIAPRVAANIEKTFSVTARTNQNQKIQIRLTNNGPALASVAVSYGGWFHPLSDVLRYTGLPWKTL